MLNNPNQIILDFVSSITTHYPAITITATDIQHELLPAPHSSPTLPQNKNSVYVFTFISNYYASHLIDSVLKVGKAGKNSPSRFKSAHYSINAKNSAAKSLNNNPILWSWLGITHTQSVMYPNADIWLKVNTDRDHFFIDSNLPSSKKIMRLLEVYLKGRYGSVLEGTAENR